MDFHANMQGMLLVWMYVAVHGLVPIAGSSPSQQPGTAAHAWPEAWKDAAGRLAAQGTPRAVLAAASLDSAEVNTGARSAGMATEMSGATAVPWRCCVTHHHVHGGARRTSCCDTGSP